MRYTLYGKEDNLFSARQVKRYILHGAPGIPVRIQKIHPKYGGTEYGVYTGTHRTKRAVRKRRRTRKSNPYSWV